MPSAKSGKSIKPASKPKRSKAKKPKKQHRGPVMRFRLSQLILLWILSLIICFGSYVYNRNVHPEKDVFVKPSADELAAESSGGDEIIDPYQQTEPVETEAPVENVDVDGDADVPADETTPEDESSVWTGTDKINPVPESAPKTPDYLTQCAFLGETNIYNLGVNHLLQPMSVYASENLKLTNYTREYVMLEGTTIRILSAVNSASCPIYLMFGTESLPTQPADQTADQFDQLLTSVKATAPEATIYVLSIPPVTALAETNGENPLPNSTIDDYNSRLLDICNLRDVYYVDVNTALKNNEGKLDADLAEEDGIHLTLEGGQILLNYVLTHIPAELQ